MDLSLQEIPFERQGPLARLAKKLVLNPLANRLPVAWWKKWLGDDHSELARANWGNPGGWQSMAFIYENKPTKTWDRLLVKAGTIPKALRNRRKLAGWLLARQIDRTAPGPAHLLCLGAGPGMITADALVLADREADATLVDLNSEAFEFGRKHAIQMGLRDRMTFIQADARDIAPQVTRRVDIVKTIGIFEYITDEQIVDMIGSLRRVMPEGSSIVFNSLSMRHGTDRFFRRVFGLHMFHRSPEHLQQLLAPAGFGGFEVFAEPLGVYHVVVARMGAGGGHDVSGKAP